MKKQIKISKKTYNNIIDAWSAMNVLCAYLESPELFTKKYRIQESAKEIYKNLDAAVAKLPDFDENETNPSSR